MVRSDGTVRERLLKTADQLFYREGIHTVGIDRILAESGVAKSSLYDNFKSKEELIRAYLEARAVRVERRIEDRIATVSTPRARILAVFDEAVDRVAVDPDYHGCPFVRANAEGNATPQAARDVASAHRRWRRALFARLGREAGSARPDALSEQLSLIYEGMSVAVHLDSNPAAAVSARSLVDRLLTDKLPAPPSARSKAKKAAKPRRD